jgi:hypothetical protein
MRCGWNMHSGASKCFEPTLIIRPSGSCNKRVSAIQRWTTGLKYRAALYQHCRLFRQFLVEIKFVAVVPYFNRTKKCKSSKRSPHIAKFLLDFTHGLEIGGTVERITAHEQQFDQVPRDISTCNVQASGEMREGKSVVHRYDVRDSIT